MIPTPASEPARVVRQAFEARSGDFMRAATAFSTPDNKLWAYSQQRIEVDQQLDIYLVRTWVLDSRKLLDITQPPDVLSFAPSPLALIPVQPINETAVAANEVQVSSFSSRRLVDPVPYRTLLSNIGFEDDWKKWLAVPMTPEEYMSFPVVGVKSRVQGEEDRSEGLNRTTLSPVGLVDVELQGEQLTHLRLRFPDLTTADVLAVFCTIDWSLTMAHIKFDQLIAELEAAVLASDTRTPASSDRDEGKRRLTLTEVLEIGDEIDTVLVDYIHANLDKVESLLQEQSKRILGRTASVPLSSGFARTKGALDHWANDYIAIRDPKSKMTDKSDNSQQPMNGRISSAHSLCGAAKRLREDLSQGLEFVLPAELTDQGQVSPTQIERTLRSLRKDVAVNRVVVPYTTESKPGSLSRRSGLVLLALGLILIAIGLAYLPSPLPLPDGPNYGTSDREILVTLLVIFPVALFGQFFQYRPQGVAAERAESVLYTVLSLLFVLPIVPAVWVAIGLPSRPFGALCLALGLIVVITSRLVWTSFTRTTLAQSRRRVLTSVIAGGGER